MQHYLSFKDILTLGIMTLAFFLGAGNIMFPPMLGIQSGEYVWHAAFGFLIMAVGLPLLGVIALARAGGSIEVLSAPIGKIAGIILAAICYLIVGPLFAIPRTSNVSFEIGLASLFGNTKWFLFCYSLFYFILVSVISLYPAKLLDIIGYILAPLKILALIFLSISACLWPAGSMMPVSIDYKNLAFSHGLLSGYLTMDALGALVFSSVIINAVRLRSISEEKLLTRYTIIAGCIAALGLIVIYLALFKIGSDSANILDHNINGTVILYTYIQHTFGIMGTLFLSMLIFISCLVTAVGLTCSCAEFFQRYLPFNYQQVVCIIGMLSLFFSNLGLSNLIHISIPILIAIYPPCIILILLSFTNIWWKKRKRVFIPVVFVSLIFGILDGIENSSLKIFLPLIIQDFPLIDQRMLWLLPSLATMFVFGIYDRFSSS
ncbi:branched-chain amino acid transport system II carrier protein [Candidatus Erwinia haradaeae]|uniref:Branched-chain amino acid transport system carrier protein n=1 Tax=Candidatus Erwinia haradaeae TaxID=1922217 RepID=A0A803FU85_9GAMM|nr:branched-chain amino acid transport system II carrier protein [Candidatus Erwinia haradaeae]VFP88643.1 Branched-chain amino acid transport system 2 carrier protein [Candidatus Erwinia haradaeae]